MIGLRAPALRLACKQMRPEFAGPVVKLLNSLKAADAKERPMAAALDEQTTLALEAFSTLRSGGHSVPVELQSMLFDKLDATTDAILARLTSAEASKPLTWQTSGNRAWQSEDRKRQEGDESVKVISSLPLGEAYTGTRTSEPFTCPASLTFWLCGHDGPPNTPAPGKNFVRLVQAETGKTLQQTLRRAMIACTKSNGRWASLLANQYVWNASMATTAMLMLGWRLRIFLWLV